MVEKIMAEFKLIIEERAKRKIKNLLEQLPKEMEKKGMQTALMKGGRLVRDFAKLYAPVDQGDLKKAIKLRSKRFRSGPGVQIVVTDQTLKKQKAKGKSRRRRKSQRAFVFGGKTFYGAFVELGTKKMKAQPFLRPALNSNREVILKVIGNSLAEDVLRSAKSGS